MLYIINCKMKIVTYAMFNENTNLYPFYGIVEFSQTKI